ncbi:unnamed protein product [Paramecium sonneborni]|uniref:CSC1/OSCA1-like cytosolic domain-containing protein n=1 Tax=Paramecium sonneborni TaxID=65129 RepID=A0A8S1QMQ3_9CILI|nr:unnamed protein product [Paramecium sonneborni]
MESEFIISKKESKIFPDIIDNCYDIPADIKKAELHGLAYRVYKEPQLNSIKCNCCGFYKDQIKYKLCDNLNEDCSAESDYFQTIKWMLLQLNILCIAFVPLGLFFNSQGDECEKHPNCDKNSLKIYSIWNLTSNYFSLSDIYYSVSILVTFVIYLIFNKYGTGSFKAQIAKIAKLKKILFIWFHGVYIPEKITNKEILSFLDQNSGICKPIYCVNLKKYEDVLFEKLKFNYLRETQQQRKKIILREVFVGNEDITQTFKQQFIYFQFYQLDDIFISNTIKKIFIRLCKNQNQKCYSKCQIGSPSFQFFIWLLIAGISSQLLMIAQFIILKIRYNLINNNVYGEEDQIIQQFLNVCFTLLSMITFKIFDLIGIKILNKVTLLMYHFCIILCMQQLQSSDFETWNMYYTIFGLSSQKMLQNGGIIDYLITLSCLNIIIPTITSILDFNYFWKKIKFLRLKMKKANNKTQIEANQLSQLREFNFYQKQIAISKIFAIGMIFGFQYPLIIPFTMLSLLILFWVDKYLFTNYAIPAKKDKYEELLQGSYFQHSISMINYFFFISFSFFKWWIYIIALVLMYIADQIGPFNDQQVSFIIIAQQQSCQFIETRDILDDIVEQQYQISNDDKFQIFLNLQKRLKKYVKKQKKTNVYIEILE